MKIKMKMKKLTTLLMALIVSFMTLSTSGCFSYMTYKSSEKKVATRKALINNDQAAIRAIRLGDTGAGIGIDVSNWEALSEQPWLQLISAVGDAGLVYGGYKGVEALNESSSGDSDNGGGNNTSGRDTIVINGDGNTVDTSAPTTTSESGGSPAVSE